MTASVGKTTKGQRFAHTLPGRPVEEWEPLSRHLKAVGCRAAEFASAFGCAGLGLAAGVLHDAGKASDAFQAYLHNNGGSVDHSGYGARIAAERYPGFFGRV